MGSAPGIVYVFTNDGLRGYRKVGRTIKTADKRAVQVSREYGTQLSFKVESKFVTMDPNAVEALAHRLLRKSRVNNTELFRVSSLQAQWAIKTAMLMVSNRPWWLRLWHSLVLPRPERAPERWRGARHSGGAGVLLVLAAAVLLALLIVKKPVLPRWLPLHIAKIAGAAEGLGCVGTHGC